MDIKYDDDLIISMKQLGHTWTEIAEEIGVKSEALRSYARAQEWYEDIRSDENTDMQLELDLDYTGEKLKKVEDKKSGSITSNLSKIYDDDTGLDELTDEDILRLHRIDPESFQIRTLTSNVYTMTNNNGERYYNFQSKIVTEPRVDEITEENIVDQFAKEIQTYETKTIKNGLTNLVIPLADLHFGIATMEMDVVREKLDRIVDIVKKGYKKIVIEQLGDLFHSSQMKSSQTLRGTLIDDVDMVKAIEDAKTFYHTIIDESLRNGGSVEIQHAAGNHSGNMEYMFLLYLQAKYPQINVVLHNEPRYAYMLDNVGILITHGNVAKNKLNSLFTTNYKQIWAQSETAEIHTGHFHTLEKDVDGIIHRQMGTFKPNDNYEIEHGWTMSKKIIQLIEYNEDRPIAVYEV